MKRNAGWITLLLMVTLLSGILSGCQQEKVVKIGLNAQLTGPDSYVGQAAQLALQDRVDEINANGGIKGYKVQLVVYDSRSEVTDAVAVAKRLMEQDRVVAIIGPEWSGAAIPIAEIANTNKVPVVATTASNINVTVTEDGKLNPYMFRVCFIDPYQGYALADFAYKELGMRKAAFIYDVSAPYSVGIMNFFEEHFVELGGVMATKEGYMANDTEFRAQLAKVQDSGADLLVVPTGTYRDIALIAQQAAALGLKIQFLGGDGWVADELLTMAGKELEGAYLSSGISSDAPEFADFNAAFEAKHKTAANVYAYYALDALYSLEYAIGVAIDKTGKPDPVAVRDALETMTDVPVFTGKMTMEPDTHNPHNKPILLMRITNSKWEIVKIFTPGE